MQEVLRVKKSFNYIATSCGEVNGYCPNLDKFQQFVDSYRGAVLSKKFYFKSDMSDGWKSKVSDEEIPLFVELFHLSQLDDESTIPILKILFANNFAIVYYGYFPEQQHMDVKYIHDGLVMNVKTSGYNPYTNTMESEEKVFILPSLLRQF